jgi:hypothetical protein
VSRIRQDYKREVIEVTSPPLRDRTRSSSSASVASGFLMTTASVDEQSRTPPFGTRSVQLRERKSGGLFPKRHQIKHLEFVISGFGTRRSEVQILSPRPILKHLSELTMGAIGRNSGRMKPNPTSVPSLYETSRLSLPRYERSVVRCPCSSVPSPPAGSAYINHILQSSRARLLSSEPWLLERFQVYSPEGSRHGYLISGRFVLNRCRHAAHNSKDWSR